MSRAAPPDEENMKKLTPEEIQHELYLYHCAGGHTRAQHARRVLIDAGFRFEKGCIFWPDGVMLTYKDGNIVQREAR